MHLVSWNKEQVDEWIDLYWDDIAELRSEFSELKEENSLLKKKVD